MKRNEIKNIINHFISEIINDNDLEISNSSKLISDQIIDSLGVIEIVNNLESKFNIVVEQSELVIENLDSIDAMKDYIYNKIK